jgi:asparagine synthase (glutamine-hydrolysing)
MCGLTGFWQAKPFAPETARRLAERMGTQIASRGPDDWGVWLDPKAGIAFAHRRLSILDLSEAGHQPMISASGRFVITFNGEIYNHLELRCQLSSRVGQEQLRWRGHSDTETLLAGFDTWGVEETLKKSVGMFAFAVWDTVDRVLYLARDRMGEKPLYYGWQDDVFLFGSELKALKVHPSFRSEINRDALVSFLRHSYIPAPHSIYKGIHKLLPGTFLVLSQNNRSYRATPDPIAYWQLSDAVAGGLQNPFAGNDAEAVSALEDRLKSAVALQMVADVPLGAFLSGGVDSSTVVALMQAQSARPVRTFTIGFYESDYNEAQHAAAVARHLGTDHTELYVTSETARNVIPRLPTLYDEPFADPSQIPTFVVSELTRQHVTVSLSGDAGDELFGGYPRYLFALALWKKIAAVPSFGRRLPKEALRFFPAAAWKPMDAVVRRFLPGRLRERPLRSLAMTGADVLAVKNRHQLYYQLVSLWKKPTDIVITGTEPRTFFTTPDAWPKCADANFANHMMCLDGITYLPDDILVKVDRAGMAVSLETRIPFLDHRVVEFAWQLPIRMKIRDGQGKWILRQVLDKYVPRELIERPKKGFGVPLDEWLRGPLRQWAEDLLSERRLKQDGFFRPEPIREKFQQHLSGEFSWQYYLWSVLMFQAWMDQQSA